ncbi:MAG: PAS domain S-box protein [Myxococcota bacterium]|nr:PAS domain S-box protein [Myxococcota bacterium]
MSEAPSVSRLPALSWDESRLLIESVEDYAIFMLDPGGNVATWNLGAEKIKGYTANEIVGRHFSTFYPEEDRSAGRPERALETVRTVGRYEDEGWRVRKDGTRFWANAVITALRDPEGRLRGFAKVTRDLTARRQAEQTELALMREQAARLAAEAAETRVRDSEERYRALSERLELILEGVADGITVQDTTGKLLFANTAAARACGFSSRAELMAASPAEIVARFEMLDERGAAIDASQLPGRRVLRGDPPQSAVIRVRDRSSGRESWSRIRASAVLGRDGQPELAINVWHDVTAEHREQRDQAYLAKASAALSSSLDYEAMLSTLANLLVPGLADWCTIHLLEGERLKNVAIAHIDPARIALAQRVESRYPPDPSADSGIWKVLRTARSELHELLSDAHLQSGARDAEHLQILRSIGLRSVLIVPIRIRDTVSGTITLVNAESGRTYDQRDVLLGEELGRRVGVAIENARLYQASQEATRRAENAAARAREASRIKDEFLATVSHELRTPLNAIVGWASLLKNHDTAPAIAKGIEVIYRNAQAQSKLIEDILDVSRIITGKLRLELKTTDLMTIVKDAIEVIRPSATAKRINVEIVDGETSWPIVGDPERLQQVVWNLLSNAVKFTEAGGSVRVAVGQENSSLVLSLTDTGRGIEPEFLPYVFDRFKQADSSTTRRVGGLGLGLAIVRHIVELHGGQVQAYSQGAGTGARFSITLPVRAVTAETEHAERPTLPAVEEREQPAAASLRGIRVVVIDDEPDARDLLKAVLSQAGAVVEVAASATEGYALVQRAPPDVLVSDLGMPDIDGYTLIRRIRLLDESQGGRVPALALSAYTRIEDRAKALASGFTRHVAKPVNPGDLVSAVAELASFSRATRFEG